MHPLCALTGVLGLVVGGTTAAWAAAPLVRNGGFAADGVRITGVGYVSQGNPITGWEIGGDRECARCGVGLAFYDNGRPPSTAADPAGAVVVAIQNRSILRQEIGPLEADGTYRLRVRANGRAADGMAYGRFGRLEVRLNQTLLIGPVEVKAVDAMGTHEAPFHTYEALFSAGRGRFPLELAQVDPADGISVLVGDVTVEPVAGMVAGSVIRVNRARSRAASEPLPGVDLRRAVWIWTPETSPPREAAPPGDRFLRRTFEVADAGRVERALLLAAADNRAEVYGNGVYGGTVAGFSRWYEIDLRESLRDGRNVIAVQVNNAGDRPNPAGFAAAVVLEGADGTVIESFVTDTLWRGSPAAPEGWRDPGFDDGAWAAAVIVGPMGCRPWGNFGVLTWLVPEEFPRFTVPGAEPEMELLRQLFWLHYPASGPLATLWDGWMSMASLWPATTPEEDLARRQHWRNVLLSRRIDREGYVSTHQHHGFGHGEGWPFPTWSQGKGIGWQFATENLPYRMRAPGGVSDWDTGGLETVSRDSSRGWILRVAGPGDAVLAPPPFDVDAFVAPFVRLQWSPDFPAGAQGSLEWECDAGAGAAGGNVLPLPLAPDVEGGQFTHVPLHRHPELRGRLRKIRLRFRNAAGGTIALAGIGTAMDTRHTVNNPCYLQGCTEYFHWTGDTAFLRQNLPRMRQALRYALTEFRVAEHGCVFAPWVGHDGTSGIARDAEGRRVVHYGHGIGANYWDLLPFGGRDCLASLYLLDALRRMAALEAAVARHPEWGVPAAEPGWQAVQLEVRADRMLQEGRTRFWNPAAGRFAACVDATGQMHDYGYTFVNCEAVYYGLADPEQAVSILDWLAGRRSVAGDTSVGEDIFHFRFGPRASTRRNTEWYTFVWSAPEGIPWGGQVQDGGAVLGFAFHEYMARLQTSGPDDAWAALRRTLAWFAEVRAAGGYRAYYGVPGRGTLQGGGTAGGLGLDCEFFESVLVPQVMLYGFAGFRALPEGFALAPRLPASWPSLEITGVRFRDALLDLRLAPGAAEIRTRSGGPLRTELTLPSGWEVVPGGPTGERGVGVTVPVRLAVGESVAVRRRP
ncbi:MAG: hypothetical protein JXR77_01150 [Lentisphaeria bacterium]|nr:hypothetical protein [Lentisphaeria bacterium]